MLVMLAFLVVGLLLGLLCGGSFSNVSNARVRGEVVFLVAFVAQAVLPRVVGRVGEIPDRALVWTIWAVPCVAAMVVAILNRPQPGFTLVAIGLLLNLVVVLANSGMPVHVANAMMAGGSESEIAAAIESSWLHVPLSVDTRMPMLADVVPIIGPLVVRGMLSVGDLMLALGAGRALFAMTTAVAADSENVSGATVA